MDLVTERAHQLIDWALAEGAEDLDLSAERLGGRLPALPASIGRLRQLTRLDLSFNQLSALPESIGRLQQLTRLDLSINQLSALPEFIGRLQQLTRLDLSINQLSALPESISQLQQLTYLDLGGNQFSALPESVGQIQQLTGLDLSRNQFSALPESVGQIQQLIGLDLSRNRLSALPEFIGQFQRLTYLDLSGNQFSALPESIGRLQQLIYLNLGHNKLSALPESIGQLQQLTELDLSSNRLSELPDGIGNLTKLLYLRLGDNPLSDALTAAIRSGPDALLEYLRTRAEGIRLYEAKLLIVGEAGAGKTSLARKLVDPKAPLPGSGESTLGIQVHRNWTFPYASSEPEQGMSANIWDFGGQEIQYATHQFFLTPNALYVLVADARRQETDYDYWFHIIRLLGRDHTPSESESVHKTQVLVLLHEKANRQVTDFDLGAHQRNFPELDIRVADADLADSTDGRVQALRDRIQRMLSQLPHVDERQPAAWRPVREAVEDRQAAHHLSLGQFRDLCTKHGIRQERDAQVLLRYLNFVGVCVYFDQDPLLKDFIITDPQWAVNALYRVLDRDEVQDRQGQLSRRFFHKTLAGEGYEEYEIDRLFRLLQKDQFEICFPLEGTDGDLHIMPQLIPPVAPDYGWEDRDNLHFEYQYPFMPKGLLARLIVRLHESLDSDEADKLLIWRKGAVLRSQNDDARAEMVETEDPRGGKVLKLRVAGPAMARRNLLTVLRYEIALTHARSFSGLAVNQRVPCSCSVCDQADEPKMYDYSELEAYVSGDRGLIYCPKGQVDVSIPKMLEGVVGEVDARSPASDDKTREGDREPDRLSDKDDSSLEKLLLAARQAPVQIFNMQQANPQQYQNTSTQHNQDTSVEQKTDVQIRIEQKHQICNELGGLFDNLVEDTETSGADSQKVAGLKKELDKARQALKKLKDNQDLEDQEAASGPMMRLKGAVEKIADAETSLGKLVGSVDGGLETAREAINLYNKLGPLFGMPPIPNPISKPSSG